MRIRGDDWGAELLLKEVRVLGLRQLQQELLLDASRLQERLCTLGAPHEPELPSFLRQPVGVEPRTQALVQ